MQDQKICKNCGSDVIDRFCSHCGQEYSDLKHTFTYFFKEFFSDLFHLDSKIFTTLKALLFRPGVLTDTYLSGKQKKFVPPLKLYFFLFFIYLFLIVFTGLDKQQVSHNPSPTRNSALTVSFITLFDITLTDTTYEQYISGQQKLPESERDNLFEKAFNSFVIKNYQVGVSDEKLEKVSEAFVHNAPKVFFFLIPAYAFILLRFFPRKKMYFMEHAIFSLHIHSFFILFSILALILASTPAISILKYSGAYFLLFLIVIRILYNFFALRKVYCEKISTLIIKMAGITILYLLCYQLATVVNIIVTIILV